MATVRAPFPLPRSARLAVFASGRGSNLASLLAAFPPYEAPQTGRVQAYIVTVISNNPDAQALERARQAGVTTHAIPWAKGVGSREAFERQAEHHLAAAQADLICLAGFMRILSPAFTERWAGRIVNIHPSLLPRHPGLHAQRQALEAGDAESGCTVHLVDAGVDTGAILLQRRVAVLPGDNEETLAARILDEEHIAYPEAVRQLLAGMIPEVHSS